MPPALEGRLNVWLTITPDPGDFCANCIEEADEDPVILDVGVDVADEDAVGKWSIGGGRCLFCRKEVGSFISIISELLRLPLVDLTGDASSESFLKFFLPRLLDSIRHSGFGFDDNDNGEGTGGKSLCFVASCVSIRVVLVIVEVEYE